MPHLRRPLPTVLRAVLLVAATSSVADAALVRLTATGLSEAYLLPEFDKKPSTFQMTYDTGIAATAISTEEGWNSSAFRNSLVDASITINDTTWRAADLYNLELINYTPQYEYEALNFAAKSLIESENAAYVPLAIVFTIESFFGNSSLDQQLFESSSLPIDTAAIKLANSTSAYFSLVDIQVSGAGIGGVYCAFNSLEIQVIPEPSAFAGALILLLGQWCSFGRYACQQCQ